MSPSDLKPVNEGVSTPRRLRGEDAVFLYAETPSMPMHTVGTMILDPTDVPGGFGFESIARTVASHIHLMPPFRQRLLSVPLGLGHPLMADDPAFRLENHLHRMAVPTPGGLPEVAELVGDLAGRPLDRSRPLWEMWAVEGLAGGRIALVMKMHHCIIDGASGSSQMAGLLDLAPDAPSPDAPSQPWDPAPLPSSLGLALRSVGSRFVGPVQLGRLAFDTVRGLGQRRRATRERASGLVTPLPDRPPPTPFNRAITPYRRVAYGSASLADVKRIKTAFGVTVNDAVLAACSLALRAYLEARGAVPEQPLHCAVPVSLKSEKEKREFSNKVSMMVVRLPIQLTEAEAVVRTVQAETEDAKRVFRAVEADLLAPWLQLVPPLLTTWGTRLFSELDIADHVPPIVNCIVSNMMGPPVPLYFGGARVDAVYPMGPVGEGMGLNITVLSNMGRLDVGVLSCRDAVPDPGAVTEAFAEAVATLLRAAERRPPGRSGEASIAAGSA